MKVYKWKKTDIDPITLLKRVDAVVVNQGYPDYVYISPKRYAEMKKYIYNEYKKQFPYSNKRKLLSSTEMHLFNFSPVVLKGLPDDIILVNDKAIEESHRKS